MKTNELWRVEIREHLMSGVASKSHGKYIVKASAEGAAAYLNHRQGGSTWKEDAITPSEQAWVAREVVEWHFHLAYSLNASVTVSCGAEIADEPAPTTTPNNVVQGIPLWELEVG
jgi:hypothetical protein